MNDWRQKGHDERKDDPPFSRIFVVCSKDATIQDLREPFSQFGIIEKLTMPRDKDTGDLKGVAYIKYTKTSEAAAALQYIQNNPLKIANKTIKAMVANQRGEGDNNCNENRYNRLFILVSKNDSDSTLREHFSGFGTVESLNFHKNKDKLAYVTFKSFLDAAKAYEKCDRKYKAVFATPRDELKRNRDNYEFEPPIPALNHHNLHAERFYNHGKFNQINPPVLPPDMRPENFKIVCVTAAPIVPEKCIWQLFNIIPGMENVDYTVDTFNGQCKAYVTYSEHRYAAAAVDKINNFEFPSGEVFHVKPETNIISKAATELSAMVQSLKTAMDTGSPPTQLAHLADAIAQASSLIKVATTNIAEPQEVQTSFCNVKLPLLQKMVDFKTPVAKRCFIVCKPQVPPLPALRDVFCRFGDLIDVNIHPNKSYGFVKYASDASARAAIEKLHGATICGAFVKVLEATERNEEDENRKRIKFDGNNHTASINQ